MPGCAVVALRPDARAVVTRGPAADWSTLLVNAKVSSSPRASDVPVPVPADASALVGALSALVRVGAAGPDSDGVAGSVSSSSTVAVLPASSSCVPVGRCVTVVDAPAGPLAPAARVVSAGVGGSDAEVGGASGVVMGAEGCWVSAAEEGCVSRGRVDDADSGASEVVRRTVGGAEDDVASMSSIGVVSTECGRSEVDDGVLRLLEDCAGGAELIGLEDSSTAVVRIGAEVSERSVSSREFVAEIEVVEVFTIARVVSILAGDVENTKEGAESNVVFCKVLNTVAVDSSKVVRCKLLITVVDFERASSTLVSTSVGTTIAIVAVIVFVSSTIALVSSCAVPADEVGSEEIAVPADEVESEEIALVSDSPADEVGSEEIAVLAWAVI